MQPVTLLKLNSSAMILKYDASTKKWSIPHTFYREFTEIVRSAIFQNTSKCFDCTQETREAVYKCCIE